MWSRRLNGYAKSSLNGSDCTSSESQTSRAGGAKGSGPAGRVTPVSSRRRYSAARSSARGSPSATSSVTALSSSAPMGDWTSRQSTTGSISGVNRTCAPRASRWRQSSRTTPAGSSAWTSAPAVGDASEHQSRGATGARRLVTRSGETSASAASSLRTADGSRTTRVGSSAPCAKRNASSGIAKAARRNIKWKTHEPSRRFTSAGELHPQMAKRRDRRARAARRSGGPSSVPRWPSSQAPHTRPARARRWVLSATGLPHESA